MTDTTKDDVVQHVLVLRELRAKYSEAGSPSRCAALDAAITSVAAASEFVLALLVAGGHVSQQKVDEARAIAATAGAAYSQPPSLLRKPGPLPPGCHCSPGRCMAPTIQGRQTPCRDPAKATRWPFVRGIGRMGDNDRALLLMLDEPPSDDQMRAIQNFLQGRQP